MERKLASIRQVSEIRPIEGADRIVVAQIDGWQLITQKDNYQPGDLCVYFEIDSFLPVEERFEFLRKACFKSTKNLGDGFRIKTMKMRGELSQGLSLPLRDFPECQALPEGTDVTDLLKVQKYEKPIPSHLQGRIRGNFPSYIRKTDQERVQNLTKRLQKHADERFEVSLKLDGSSCTIYKNYEGIVGVCSRNLDLKEPEEGEEQNTFWKVARTSNVLKLVEDFNKPVAFQGELMGPGVQHNRENLDDHYLYIFDIWDIEGQRYLRPDERRSFMDTVPSIKHVPIIYHDVVLKNLLHSERIYDDILKLAERPSINHPIAEGIVFKSLDSDFTFKAINNQFLLKEKD
jgi:RNA ligase (TIGR02306 family)